MADCGPYRAWGSLRKQSWNYGHVSHIINADSIIFASETDSSFNHRHDRCDSTWLPWGPGKRTWCRCPCIHHIASFPNTPRRLLRTVPVQPLIAPKRRPNRPIMHRTTSSSWPISRTVVAWPRCLFQRVHWVAGRLRSVWSKTASFHRAASRTPADKYDKLYPRTSVMMHWVDVQVTSSFPCILCMQWSNLYFLKWNPHSLYGPNFAHLVFWSF